MVINGIIWRLYANLMAIYDTFGRASSSAKAINGIIWRLCANVIAINGIIFRLYANLIVINDIKKSPSVQGIEPKGIISKR